MAQGRIRPVNSFTRRMKSRAAVHQATPAERVHATGAAEEGPGPGAEPDRISTRPGTLSPQRPTMHLQPLYQNVLYVAPWGMYGACPVPYTVWVP